MDKVCSHSQTVKQPTKANLRMVIWPMARSLTMTAVTTAISKVHSRTANGTSAFTRRDLPPTKANSKTKACKENIQSHGIMALYTKERSMIISFTAREWWPSMMATSRRFKEHGQMTRWQNANCSRWETAPQLITMTHRAVSCAEMVPSRLALANTLDAGMMKAN